MLNKASKYGILGLFLIVLLSLTVTAPGTVITNIGSLGYQIETTPYTYMKLNQNFTANFHVFNLSDGKPLSNASINCELHVYDQSGNHILKNPKLPFSTADNEWEVYMSNGNFSQTGIYSWIIYCNSSSYGGFRSETFKITNDGFNDTPTDTSSGLSVTIFMILLVLGLFLLGIFGTFNDVNEVVNLVIKRGLITGSIMLAMFTSTLLLNIVSYAHLDILKNQMIFLMTWFGWAGYLSAAFLVLMTLFDIINIRKKMRNKKVTEIPE